MDFLEWREFGAAIKTRLGTHTFRCLGSSFDSFPVHLVPTHIMGGKTMLAQVQSALASQGTWVALSTPGWQAFGTNQQMKAI